jgi:hypothetical protein
MKKKEFIEFLETILRAVKENDTLEGWVEYERSEEFEEYNVDAVVRVGNSEGQGSCMMVNDTGKVGPKGCPKGDTGPQGDSGFCPNCGAVKTGTCMRCGKGYTACNCEKWEPAGCGCDNEVKTIKIPVGMVDFLNENPY